MKLIAFTGPMGAGKSTAIELIKAFKPSQRVENVKFAQPLYDIQEYIYNRISSVHTRDASFVKDRKLLQWLGTDWGREQISPNLWIDLWKAEVIKVDQHSRYSPIITCDDVRFDNEAQAVRALGGIVVKITSDKNIDRISTANGIANHTSEKGVSDSLVDHYINNNKTISDLESVLFSIYKQIQK